MYIYDPDEDLTAVSGTWSEYDGSEWQTNSGISVTCAEAVMIEVSGIESPKDAQEAAGSVAASLRRFSRGRNLFSDTKVPQATDDADAAPEEIVVTPHGHESDQYTEPEEEISTPSS